MNNNLKNIPIQFLKNFSFNDNYNTEVYISSTKINKKTENLPNDNIWILLIILIIFDII
ncbi:hypothetical protein [[Clostridium] colinum]|uniref:hypothetical protein n=1 Tax=[Clostridium] colinum TaxID=36835 RepID=UPI002024370C|nr:hypothetical protein [[Clostridium] colinum]